MLKRTFPHLEDGSCPDELIFALSCSDEVRKLAGIGVNKLARYKSGAEAVPARVFKLLRILNGDELPEAWGEWQNLRCWKGRLYLADEMRMQDGIMRGELISYGHTRADLQMIAGQCDLIERLTKERNFYKQHCGFTAKHGLMLWRCFGN